MRRRWAVTAIAIGLVAIGQVAIGSVTSPAIADDCPSPSGTQLPFPTPDTTNDFDFVGRGWGHGVGMSQYAARGGARLGCTAGQILKASFPGTSVTQGLAVPNRIRVGLYPAGPNGSGYHGPVSSFKVENLSTGGLKWKIDGAVVGTMPAGATWTIARVTSGGFSLTGTNAPAGELGDSSSRLSVAMSGNATIGIPSKGRSYRYGFLQLGASGSSKAWVVIDFGDMDKYLHGLAEMPATWEADARAALRAQAIVARSYATRAHQGGLRSNCQCHLYDSTASQVYGGVANEDPRWTNQVDATAGRLLAYGGKVAQTFYASSHGGHSEASAAVWGGSVPYLQPVNVARWEAAGDVPAHHAQWSLGINAADLGNLFGIGPITSVELPQPRGASGRIGDPALGYGGVVLRSGGTTKIVSGNSFRSKMNTWSGSQGFLFRSTLFRVAGGAPVPLSGDWDGDGDDDVGWFDDGRFRLRLGNGSTLAFFYGTSGDIPVTGDWNGDGVDTVGVVRAGRWLLRNSNTGGHSDLSFHYGTSSDTPVVGNWDGGRGDKPGIRRGKSFHLKFELSGGTADRSFAYGVAGDTPITGDFDHDGRDEVGLVRGDSWLLKYSLSGGSADVAFHFARPDQGDLPLTGDWNGDRTDTVGVARGFTSFLLKNQHSGGKADVIINFAS